MDRFELLQQAEVIDHSTYQAIKRVIQQFNDWHINCKTEQVEMLLTHLAMALMRIQNNTPESQPLAQEIYQEIESDEQFKNLLLVHQKIVALIKSILPEITIPFSEESYLIANLYSLTLSQPNFVINALSKGE